LSLSFIIGATKTKSSDDFVAATWLQKIIATASKNTAKILTATVLSAYVEK